MNILSEILPSPVIQAIGWTLLHSVWQGFVIALLLAILLLCLQKSSAAIRYFLSTGAMLTFAIVAALTFVSEYTQASIQSMQEVAATPAGTKAMGLPLELSIAARIESPLNTWSLKNSLPAFQAYFGQHLPLIVLLWGMGITLLIIRFTGGYAYMQRLKNYKTVELPHSWQQTLATLAHAAKITEPVKLVESALVKVPIVVGYFKPVILLPVGTIIGLPAEQVEAILAHELAHIYRKDYLVNIFQCLLEITFFYHPGIWWISSRIREEREHCCDDLALSICGNTITFAKALANIGYVAYNTPALAMGFPGKGNQLVSRIRRLATAPGRKPDFMEGFLAACFVMLSISVISVSAGINNDTSGAPVSQLSVLDTMQQTPAVSQVQVPSDTTKNTFTFKGTRNGQRYDIEAVMESGEITALTVNGNKVPTSDIYKYQELIFELMGAVPAPAVPAVASVAPHPAPAPVVAPHPVISGQLSPARVAEPPAPPASVLAPMNPDDLRGLIRAAFLGDTTKRAKGDFVYHFTGKNDQTYKITIKDGVLTELKVDGKKIDKKDYPKYVTIADDIGEGMFKEYNKSMAHYDEAMKQHDMAMKELDKSMLKQEEALKLQEIAMQEHERAMVMHDESAKLSKELIHLLNTELAKDKLIQKDKAYYIQISPEGLFIDYNKQPDEVFQRYKALLEKKAGKKMEFTIQYHYNQDETNVNTFMMNDRERRGQDPGLEKHRKAMEEHDALVKSLNNYLVKENLVKNKKTYHIRLSPEGLFIDKVKQPDEVFNRFKEQVEEQTGGPFVYTLEYDYTHNK